MQVRREGRIQLEGKDKVMGKTVLCRRKIPDCLQMD